MAFLWLSSYLEENSSKNKSLFIGGLQMKKVGKPVFFVTMILIVLVTVASFTGFYTQYGDIKTTWIKGAQDIRWGIDIQGGVDATFVPAPVEGQVITPEMMTLAQSALEARLIAQNITDYEIYTDSQNQRIIVRFPWKADETDFNPEQAITELGETSLLTFREGSEQDETGAPSGVTAQTILLQGTDVASAVATYTVDETTGQQKPVVALTMSAEGTTKFAEATGRLQGQTMSIWMDNTMISAPVVNATITEGSAIIDGMESLDAAKELADQINAGALPFAMTTDTFSTISPQLGTNAKDAMVMAGVIAFVLIVLIMIIRYRIPGLIAAIALTGQVGLMIAAVTGFFSFIPSFTLTIPGIAGIILSIGFGVDANVITAERIKEEIQAGKTIDGAIANGYHRAFSAIFDGNVTVIIVAVILMGAFGPTGSFFSQLLTPFFFYFGASAAGSIYSFGYTLLVGVVCNFVMGVWASKLMLQSISRFKPLRKLWYYGGEK